MKKYNVNVYDNCGCEKWVEAFVRELFDRAEIKAEEVVIYDMDDRRISLQAEVWDETMEPDEMDEEPGGWVDKSYTIRYFEDDKRMDRMLLSFKFYDNERVIVEEKTPDGRTLRSDTPRYIDQGAYKIVAWWGKARCIRMKH